MATTNNTHDNHHHHNHHHHQEDVILLHRPIAFRSSNNKAVQCEALSTLSMTSSLMNMQSLADATGLPMDSQELTCAREDAMEWHRKWTMQEETGHTGNYMERSTNPFSDSDTQATSSQSLHSAAPMQVKVLRPVPLRPYVVLRDEQPSPLTFNSPSEAFPEQHNYQHHHHDTSIPTFVLQQPPASLETLKDALLHALACCAGNVDTKMVEDALLPLVQEYEQQQQQSLTLLAGHDPYDSNNRMEGMWLTLSKATYFGTLGQTPGGDPLYTLGRMAFDMFLPTQLVCSLQGNFNPVHRVGQEEREEVLSRCPKSLLDELELGDSVLRTYNIITAFTIEPHQQEFPNAPNKDIRRPIMGIMTTYGYILPDPNVANRLSIWFTGGRIEPNDSIDDQREWNRFFGNDAHLTPRSLGEKIRCLAANLLMGANPPKSMNSDGSMEFDFERPLGGHGVSYVDVLYLDDSLRVVRGHRGTIFCFTRIPEPFGTDAASSAAVAEQW